ncbi:MAG TPA: ABC transporter permease [Terriglobia bacterium]|nr:ABC transporter permease [Terriglobia bacterium]
MPDWKGEITRRLERLKLAPTREAEITEELAQHLDDRYRELVAGGTAEDEARRVAIEELEDEDLLARGLRKVEQETPQEPILFGGNGAHNLLAGLWQDIRYGLRQSCRNAGFSSVAILVLSLGIGANTAMFSIVNAVLLEPLPFHDPGRLVELQETESAPGKYPLTGPDYLDWQAQNHTLAATSLYGWPSQANLSLTGEAAPATVLQVQANFFSAVGVQPLLGRTFAEGEDVAGRNRVAVLSYSVWQQQFGGQRDTMGKNIELDGQSYAVVGVMPRWFTLGFNVQVWKPLDMSAKNLAPRGAHRWQAFARLKPGVTASQASADLTAIEERLGKLYPHDDAGVKAVVTPLQEDLRSGSRGELLILLAAVAFVLLIACANIAGLLLARATSRSHEMALRAALGANRWRLARQLLTESVLLALAGGAAALAEAYGITRYVQSAPSLPIPRLHPIAVDFRVLLFAFAVSVLVGILFGLAPALQASDMHLAEELKPASKAVLGSSGGRQALRDALVVGEIAVSLALLVGAGLLLRTFARMRDADIGVAREGLLTMGLSLPAERYANAEQRSAFLDSLLTKVRHTPGVSFAALSSEIPLEGGSNGYITVPGNNNPAFAKQLVEWNYITQDYFQTYGTPFLRGHDFTAEDMQQAAETGAKLWAAFASHAGFKGLPSGLVLPAVISRSMAQTFWPHDNPIGKVFETGPVGNEVIGVVGDVKEWAITKGATPEAYFPLTAALDYLGASYLAVRTSVAPLSVLGDIRHDVATLDGSLAVDHPRAMQQVVGDHMRETNFETVLLGLFAVLALILAVTGIYGVTAYLVARRRREFGIRMALGAQRKDVLELVVTQGLKLVVIGVAIGITGALALTRFLSSLLYGVKPTDPVTFVAVSLILTVVALLACYIPARRATEVDPMVALRQE